MKHEEIIYRCVNNIDWEYVLESCKRFHLKLKNNHLTTKELIEDLVFLLKNALKTKKKTVCTNFWTIHILESEKDNDICLECSFTPIVVWIDNLDQTSRDKEEKIKDLKNKIQLALEIEDYTTADKYTKSLKKLLK